MRERWQRCPSWPQYDASEDGAVRGVSGKVLTQGRDKDGYAVVHIYLPQTATRAHTFRKISVARLVADAFLGPCPVGLQVNHKDGNKTNCARLNVEYVTPRENIQHAIHVLGKRRDGEYNPTAKFTAAQVHEIRTRHGALGETYAKLASLYGCCENSIGNIISGRTWADGA